MGAWDIGHFDNDTAADFGGQVDDAEPEKKADVLRAVLTAAADTAPEDYLDEGEEAVAAAALVAAQCPGGEPIATAYGPKDPVPRSRPTSARWRSAPWTVSPAPTRSRWTCGPRPGRRRSGWPG